MSSEFGSLAAFRSAVWQRFVRQFGSLAVWQRFGWAFVKTKNFLIGRLSGANISEILRGMDKSNKNICLHTGSSIKQLQDLMHGKDDYQEPNR